MVQKAGVTTFLIQLGMIVVGLELLCFSPAYAKPSLSGKIVGGTQAQIVDFPYYGAMNYSKSFTCGCILIDSDTALTAAHCVVGRNEPASNFHLIFGVSNLTDRQGITVTVSSIVIHEDYDASNGDNDIAILKFYPPVMQSSTVDFASLPEPDSKLPDETECIVVGHGTEMTGGSISIPLKKSTLYTQNHNECKLLYYFIAPVTDGMICAGNMLGNNNACNGDSGGPMVITKTRVLCGIVSRGVVVCASPLYRTVYTDVAYYITWIAQNRS